MNGTGPDSVDVVEKLDVEKSEKGKMVSKKKNVKKDGDDNESGFWFRIKFIFSCISSRSKVDSSMNATNNGSMNATNNGSMTATNNGPMTATNNGSMNANTVNAQPKHVDEKPEDKPAPSTEISCAESGYSTPLIISGELKYSSKLRIFMFNDLKLATRNFRPESLLGEGGFGCVFKGWIEENGTAPVKPGTGLTVAVKTLNPDGLQGHKEWLAEINFLGNLVHPSLVKLVGYCMEDDQRLLVYEFMPRGSLENHLFRRTLPLPWSVRMKIAVGAAKGLAFLHEEAEKPVIYRDFKTSNILLDADYNSKLSDFGLAKDAPDEKKSHVSTRVMGTYGYAAPEYVMTGHLTTKSDVYSFGVVLLEILTGRRAVDKSRPNGEQNLVEWVRPHLLDKKRFYRLLDPRLEGHFSIKGAQKATQVAAQCLNRDSKARPKMSEVVEALKPLPNLKDFASSSSSFQTMQPVVKNGVRTQGGGFASRNGQPLRSLSSLNLPQASPYRQARQSPKPKGTMIHK